MYTYTNSIYIIINTLVNTSLCTVLGKFLLKKELVHVHLVKKELNDFPS